MFILSTYTFISLPRTPDCVIAEARITEFFGETQIREEVLDFMGLGSCMPREAWRLPSPQPLQETNTGAKAKMPDHYRCTITCAFCGKRKHYEDECYHKQRLSAKLKGEDPGKDAGKGSGKGNGNDSGRGKSKGRGKGQDKSKGGRGGGANRQPDKDNKNPDKNGGNPNPNPGGNSESSGGRKMSLISAL